MSSHNKFEQFEQEQHGGKANLHRLSFVEIGSCVRTLFSIIRLYENIKHSSLVGVQHFYTQPLSFQGTFVHQDTSIWSTKVLVVSSLVRTFTSIRSLLRLKRSERRTSASIGDCD